MYYNHLFIYRHNLYHFEPKLPEQLDKILEFLESQYSLRCDFGCSTYRTLGRLYGSIAQNYAFCGPDYLQDTESLTLKARKALGEGSVPEFKDEWMRQLNYLTYAALDAGRFHKAEETLIRYLEIEEWEDVWPLLPALSPWRHALLARFLADTENQERGERYLSWALAERKRLAKPEHPWQLWLFNLGRIAQQRCDTRTATELYNESLNLCLSEKNGLTVHMMALLPISGLWRLGVVVKTDIKKQEKEVREAAGMLNLDHFRMLLDEKDFEKVLEAVWDKPGTLFPFAYR